jgi:hypothetical protein
MHETYTWTNQENTQETEPQARERAERQNSEAADQQSRDQIVVPVMPGYMPADISNSNVNLWCSVKLH